MYAILETLLPVILVIALGWVLGKAGRFPDQLLSATNKLVYFIGLPSLILRGLTRAEGAAPGILLVAFLTATIILLLISAGVAALIRLPRASYGTLMQAAFRGNLVFIAVPVLLFANRDLPEPARDRIIAAAAMVFAPMMVFYNIASITVLQLSRSGITRNSIAGGLREMAKNPLIIASLTGMAFIWLDWEMPLAADLSLKMAGDFAVPLALLGVGASLHRASVHGKRIPILAAAFLKVAALPAIGLLVAKFFALDAESRQIFLIFCATPTATISYVTAVRMDGDAELASGAIFASTLLSAVSLTAALAL